VNDEWLKATTSVSLERIRTLLEEGIAINSKDTHGRIVEGLQAAGAEE
jgi:hypothetical protein